LEERYPDLSNPFGVTAAADLLQTGREVGGALFALGLLAAAASLLLRLRVAKGEQRQQLKWFVYVAAVMAAGFGGEILLKPLLGPAAEAGFMIGILALAVLPIAVGIAVLRYRLYEIDRLINRTLVYAALTAGLASVYWATVAVLEQFLRPLTQGSELAVIGSTLAVAALFRPARRWIQDSVDRRFYRRRYDTTRTLEAFGARLRDEVDLGNLSVELLAVVRGTVQPAHASLWLRPTERRAAPDAPPQAAPSNQSA
jgi:hypothetical protein